MTVVHISAYVYILSWVKQLETNIYAPCKPRFVTWTQYHTYKVPRWQEDALIMYYLFISLVLMTKYV